MASPISFAELARQVGISRQAVAKAAKAGHLDLTATGVDLDGKRTRAWLARQRKRRGVVVAPVVTRTNSNPAILGGMTATLAGRYYERALWHANTREVEDFANELHDDCDYFLKTAENLPVEVGCMIALTLGVSPAETVDRIDRALRDWLDRVGDQHKRVDATIEKVQAQWVDYPIRRVPRPPAIPEFTPPATEHEARALLAEVRGELVHLRMRFRSGELVSRAAAAFAGDDLRAKWATMLGNDFPVGVAAQLFPEGSQPWAFAQTCACSGGGRLSSYWGVGPAYGGFGNAMKIFMEERWKRHGGYPQKHELDALRAEDQARGAEADRLRRERLLW